MPKKSDAKMIEDFLKVAGIPVNPELPADWDNTPNDARPACHRKLWDRPYITTQDFWPGAGDKDRWLKAWPTGTRYDVRCLDGGAWDRSTNHGSFKTLAEAVKFAEGMLTGENRPTWWDRRWM